MKNRRRGTLAALLLIAALPALAAEGRKEIFQQVVLDGNLSDITGNYFVSRNITATGPGPVITIIGTGVEAVDINLNGFTLTGNAGDKVILATQVRSLALRTGTVIAPPPVPFAAVDVVGSGATNERLTVEGLDVAGGALWINGIENVALRRNMITDSDWGIGVFGTASSAATGLIEGNLIRNLSAHGIALSYVKSMMVRENQVENAGFGLALNLTGGVHLVGNSVSGNTGGLGIRIEASSACSLVQNVVNDCGNGLGIQVLGTTGCSILDNTVTNNAAQGLVIEDSTEIKVQRNAISGNASYGLHVVNSDRCELRDNTLSANGQYGLYFTPTSDDNTYGDNTIRGNAGGGCTNPGPALCGGGDLCDEGTGNTSFGDNLTPGPPPC